MNGCLKGGRGLDAEARRANSAIASFGAGPAAESEDATAARAKELGGSAIVEPHDTPGFRNAVLADPQGATFSVSQLVRAGA